MARRLSSATARTFFTSCKAAVVIAEWEESLMYKQIEAIARGEDGLALDVDWASGARI